MRPLFFGGRFFNTAENQSYEEVEFLLFSLTGFSKWVKENIRPDRVRLVTLEELYQNR